MYNFIERAKVIHGNKYDYSKVKYINNHTKVCIICPEHGEFWQIPHNHLSGYGCSKCKYEKIANLRKKSIHDFIQESKEIHGNKYDYSKAEYVNCSTKLCIICPEHGEFWQTPNAHTGGCGCPMCANVLKSDTKTFIKRSKEIHGDKYDYTKVNYINNRTKVCIICPIHGEFWQTPKNHLRGQGCNKCAIEYRNHKLLHTTEEFVKKAREIHGDKYDYSKAEYFMFKTPVCIICPEHGEFWQTPREHLSGCGCPECSKCKNLNETALYEFINSHISEKVVREKHMPWLGMKSLDIYIPKYHIAIEYQGLQHFKPLDFFGGEKTYKKAVKRDELKYNQCKANNTHLFYFSKEKNLPDTYFDKIYTDENELLEKIVQIIDKG